VAFGRAIHEVNPGPRKKDLFWDLFWGIGTGTKYGHCTGAIFLALLSGALKNHSSMVFKDLILQHGAPALDLKLDLKFVKGQV
jgi:hypothetical protein